MLNDQQRHTVIRLGLRDFQFDVLRAEILIISGSSQVGPVQVVVLSQTEKAARPENELIAIISAK